MLISLIFLSLFNDQKCFFEQKKKMWMKQAKFWQKLTYEKKNRKKKENKELD